MGSKRFLSLKDLEKYMNEYEEDLDENILEDTVPNDVPGPIEIHGIPSNEAPQNKKIKKDKISSNWQKERASFTAYDYNIWKDNNIVKVLSNHQEVLPLDKASRWSRAEHKQVSIPQPNAIAQYNKFMGGVDRMD
ncbi:hypothetical protein ILUMI_03510 [Ignelater luminosus]|uniref:PiggyBac transposable element-derived protein domain-containing protein n=1 Tax=Ignelater luminosus TaxID=2038154 RepID=A0A8K0DEE5_IGNLU|nr:hypothetical protein ILUMI_03510 [Ignelater luminosus]